MKTISADDNAMTGAEHICLTTLGSQEDIARTGLRAGDWAWLTDSELVVGAHLAIDDRYGLVGVPDWDTLVHLDDEDDRDPARIQAELHDLLQKPDRSTDEELRVFQLLTLVEEFSLPEARSAVRPGYFPYQRAAALVRLSKPELALLEIEEARRLDPGDVDGDRLFLDILRRTDLPRARHTAKDLATRPDVPARVLAECINVLATYVDTLPDDQYEPVGRRILEWADRFEQAPGRERVRVDTLAQLLFNKGLILLRLGDVTRARMVIALGLAVDPILSEIDEATRLTVYDQRAREHAARVRARPTAA